MVRAHPTKNSKPKVAELEKQTTGQTPRAAIEFRVSEKRRGSAFTGLGPFPRSRSINEQWTRLLGAAEDLKTFLEDNKGRPETERVSLPSSTDQSRNP